MTTIDLGKPPENAAEFHLLRGAAINAYANVEGSLSMLLSGLIGAEPDVGAIIFYKITNTSSRNQIIDELLTKRFADRFEHYWYGIPKTPHKKGLSNLVKELDTERNKIVHWHTVTHVEMGTQPHRHTISLTKPNFFQHSAENTMGNSDLSAFIKKADFVGRSINMFALHAIHQPRLDYPSLPDPWPEIFRQPCVYPPSSTHPLLES